MYSYMCIHGILLIILNILNTCMHSLPQLTISKTRIHSILLCILFIILNICIHGTHQLKITDSIHQVTISTIRIHGILLSTLNICVHGAHRHTTSDWFHFFRSLTAASGENCLIRRRIIVFCTHLYGMDGFLYMLIYAFIKRWLMHTMKILWSDGWWILWICLCVSMTYSCAWHDSFMCVT